MRKVKVTDENIDSFEHTDTIDTDILLTIDELLQRHGLELVVGDNQSSDYSLKIEPTLEDGEYDRKEAKRILFSV